MAVVLLVDDDAAFREALFQILRSKFASLDITEAAEGDEVLEIIESHRPDLIFMDIRLPGENGLVLTKRIKDLSPAIEIIILTNYDLPEYREAASEYGADYFFSKEATPIQEIIEVVASLLSERGKTRS
jgi:DNA-binding NarL/FixJ family response regulator